MRIIAERAGFPEPIETGITPCPARCEPLDEDDGFAMYCTRFKNHDGPHMAAFEDNGGDGPTIVGPIWED